ncbi:hypothetical protein JG688_00018053 [Phytophthora aleatoria]|uniref:RxLR effector protein n=1 Tax=Phytophthora aleatoria TaxID=2496075 RepID=A0A8J5IQ01_9STRA|nr:hypothetical protein JG688_00018053 [Phytophthora aleatoria]
MRLYYIVLFAAAALLTTSEGCEAADKADEERGIAIAGLQNLVKPGAKKAQVQLWLTQRKPADAAFKLFKLENTKGRLFGTKEVLDWAKHVAKIDKKNAGVTMLEALLKHYDDAQLARMIQSAKSSNRPGVKNLASKLQEVQFLKWMKASERPSVIEEKLKALGNLDLWSKQDEALVGAYKYFIGAT